MDVSQPPQTINPLSSSELSNVHFSSGQLQTRPGFGVKYQGLPEPIFALHRFYEADGTFRALMAFGLTGVWQFHTDDVFKPIVLWNNAVPEVYNWLTTLVTDAYYSIAVGAGQYTPHKINAAAQFPTSGYNNILAFTNGADGVYIVIPGTDGDPLSGELLDDTGTDGFSGAVAVAFFNNRLIIMGTTANPSEVTWSASGDFENFAGVGAGTAVLADDADKIQAGLLMREFLIVYKERSIYIGRATGRSDIAIVFEKGPGGNIGTVAPMSVVGTADEHFFLGMDDVYKFSLDYGVQPIGKAIRDELFGRIGARGIDPQYLIRSAGAIIREANEYWLFTASGNLPNVTNVITNGDMSMVFFSADTTITNPNITNVPAFVFGIIRRLEAIEDNAFVINVIPAGTVVESYSSGTSTIVMDNDAISTNAAYPLSANNPMDWRLSISGAVTLSTELGGNIGGIFQRLTLVGVAHATLSTNNTINITAVGAGAAISGLFWVRSDTEVEATFKIYCYTAADIFIETKEFTKIIPAGSAFNPYIVSFTSTEATFRKVKVEIRVDDACVFDIDAVQVVELTNVDPRFWYQSADGYFAPGLLTRADSNEVTLIPYIAGSVGPWSCDTVWVYNYRTSAWAVWKLFANCTAVDTIQSTPITIAQLVGTIAQQLWRFDSQELTTLSPSNLLGTSDGQVFELAKKYRYDRHGFLDNAILSFWQSKDFDLETPHIDKTVSRVIIFHERSHPPTEVEVGVSLDSGNTWTRQTVTIRSGHTETYADFFVTGPQIRFEVRAESPGFYVTGFSLKLIPRGETNAY